MYKLMIVDSDIQAGQRIVSGIDMEKLGIELCPQAENGMQAIELFMRYRPEIIITEIAVPLHNGLDIAKQIMQMQRDTSVIVLSESATPAHMREGIRCGVVDFISKPVDLAELETALRKCIDRAQTVQQQKQRNDILERELPKIRSAFFLQLLQTPEADVDRSELADRLQEFSIPEDAPQICTAILVPNYAKMSAKKICAAAATLADELQKMMQPLDIGTVIVQDNMQRTVMICYGKHDAMAAVLAEKLSFLRDKLRYVYRRDFHAAVGKTVNSFTRVQESRSAAEEALCYWTSMGDNHIINAESLQGIELPPMQIPSVHYTDIMVLLSGKSPEQISATLEQYLRQMAYETRNSVHNVQMLAIELLATLTTCAREMGGNVEALFQEKPMIYVKIMQQSSIHEIIEQVQCAAYMIAQSIQRRHDDSKYRALSDAKHYIMQNYADPGLSLAKVAEQVNLSASYISQLFKRNDDYTFTEYLNRVRIEQAKHLLSTTHMRVYEVSDAVGYKSAKYFFQLFKQITGKRPREFYQSSVAEQAKK